MSVRNGPMAQAGDRLGPRQAVLFVPGVLRDPARGVLLRAVPPESYARQEEREGIGGGRKPLVPNGTSTGELSGPPSPMS